MEPKTNVSPTAHPAYGGILQGQRIGYVRVSSYDQNPERQLEQVEIGKLFTDKASGKDTQRPQLEAMLGFVREAIPWWCTAWIAWRATSTICAVWCKG